MARVIVTKSLENQINKKFKKESIKIFELIYSLKNFPKKGKHLGHVGGIAIKELKYKSNRFYFITDNHKIKFLDVKELCDMLIKFVGMSDKKSQQKTIDEIKKVLRMFGEAGFL
ncbi:hypothetical protein J4462_00220 [Candidatus Pacearchaeota archaeon]|nr:hypothetical protein [Candidatus Pacearchaeota archaeon]